MSSRASSTVSADTHRLGRLRAHGPWLEDENGRKVTLRGVTYGPFKPNSRGEPWPEDAQLFADLAHIRELGFNVVRTYESPTDAVLSTCEALGLRLLCGVPWTQHVDFMADREVRRDALQRVTNEARRLSTQTAVIALLVGNEIEKTLIRWMGPERVCRFLEALITAAKLEAPELLVSYASYPSTEYLVPKNADFVAFNVFLERREVFASYLQRLQTLAASRPLVITEFGLDARAHGEATQKETLLWQREICEQAAIAGNFWFSYTDEWQRGGEEVAGWEFGLTMADRRPKAVCTELGFKRNAPEAGMAPRISVVVCTRNGAATLRECLIALQRLKYPDYEVLLIDDGSTDATPEIACDFAFVQYHRQSHVGLSAARNLGAKRATGEIIAYTDDDCVPDEDWLTHLSRAFEEADCVAAGGPNLPPPPRSFAESVVALAPGAPAEVLLNAEEAEHLPGCNLAIRKETLREIGGFHEDFTAAGDDVDVCWRLQTAGGRLRFAPSAVVWHHRRASMRAYLRQQSGYGRAEAQLIQHHPTRFAWVGGARWRGAIYGNDPVAAGEIQYGRFGLAPFQCVYQSGMPHRGWDRFLGLPWLMLTACMLLCGFWLKSAPWFTLAMSALSLTAAWKSASQKRSHHQSLSTRQRALLWVLCLMQPIVRDGARWRGIMALKAWPKGRMSWPFHFRNTRQQRLPGWRIQLFRWAERGDVTRWELLEALQKCARETSFQVEVGSSTDVWDLKLLATEGCSFLLRTVTEYHEQQVRVTLLEVRWLAGRGLGLIGLPSAVRKLSRLVQSVSKEAGFSEHSTVIKARTPHLSEPLLGSQSPSCEVSEA